VAGSNDRVPTRDLLAAPARQRRRTSNHTAGYVIALQSTPYIDGALYQLYVALVHFTDSPLSQARAKGRICRRGHDPMDRS